MWNDKSATYRCVSNWFSFVFWVKSAGRSVQIYEKWSIFSIFRCLGPFTQVFGQVNKWLMLELHKIITVSDVIACLNVFLFFFWMRLAGRSVQSYEKWSLFSVFSRLGTFPQVFRHAKEVLILQLHETIRLPHIDASPIDFLLFYQQSCQGGVFKLWKMIIF